MGSSCTKIDNKDILHVKFFSTLFFLAFKSTRTVSGTDWLPKPNLTTALALILIVPGVTLQAYKSASATKGWKRCSAAFSSFRMSSWQADTRASRLTVFGTPLFPEYREKGIQYSAAFSSFRMSNWQADTRASRLTVFGTPVLPEYREKGIQYSAAFLWMSRWQADTRASRLTVFGTPVLPEYREKGIYSAAFLWMSSWQVDTRASRLTVFGTPVLPEYRGNGNIARHSHIFPDKL